VNSGRLCSFLSLLYSCSKLNSWFSI
jgi:hypothetical protein